MEQRKNELMNLTIDELLSYCTQMEKKVNKLFKASTYYHTKWWGAKIQLGKAKVRLNGTQ
tara:strand:+ start:53 stop:232 length:180 start_codon:yes stop_codon:yes gene_type:complete